MVMMSHTIVHINCVEIGVASYGEIDGDGPA